MSEQSTLVIIKPDAVGRGLIGKILARIERKGLRIEDLRMTRVSAEVARRHYAEHLEKPFYGELEAFITSAPVVVVKVSGREAVAVVRALMGATDPVKAESGTIRGDLSTGLTENLVHGSDSPESAERELALFFPDGSGADRDSPPSGGE
jgi:nucleoside-diphosphate kinase